MGLTKKIKTIVIKVNKRIAIPNLYVLSFVLNWFLKKSKISNTRTAPPPPGMDNKTAIRIFFFSS